VVGDTGTILKTNNGGTNWVVLSGTTDYSLNSVKFPVANIGYAVGANGEIIKTINGGSNWTNQTSGTSYNLRSVYCINADTGYVVGNHGTILKTTNGGGFPVGIDNHNPNANFLNIYPNPTNGIFTLETNAPGHLMISDFIGHIIREQDLTGKESLIDIRLCKSGVYILKLSYEGTTAIRKVVKW